MRACPCAACTQHKTSIHEFMNQQQHPSNRIESNRAHFYYRRSKSSSSLAKNGPGGGTATTPPPPGAPVAQPDTAESGATDQAS